MGMVHRWAQIGSMFPAIANFFTHAPGFQQAAKWIAGIAPERTIPRLATQSFRTWFLKRAPQTKRQKSDFVAGYIQHLFPSADFASCSRSPKGRGVFEVHSLGRGWGRLIILLASSLQI
jgi:hypothetical protein